MNWMNNIVKKLVHFSCVLLGIGVIFFAIGAFDNKNILIMNCGFFLFSIGIAGLGLGFAVDSSNKMKSIANVQFLQVVNMLEDARIEFNKTLSFIASIKNLQKIPPFPTYSPELFTWKTKSCVEMAVELLKIDETKKYIDPYYRKKLLQYFKMSFNHFFKYHISEEDNWTFEIKSHEHLIESYAMLDEYYGDKLKQELKKSINDEVKIVFNDFFKRVEEKKKELKKEKTPNIIDGSR